MKIKVWFLFLTSVIKASKNKLTYDIVEPFKFSNVQSRSFNPCHFESGSFCRSLKAKKSQLRHAARFKLPSGKVLAAVPGDHVFETKDFIFKAYYDEFETIALFGISKETKSKKSFIGKINDNAQNKVVIIMARQGHYNWIDMGSNNELQSSYSSDKIDIRPKKVYGEQRQISKTIVDPGPINISIHDTLGLEEKIFRILDLKQDLQELTDLHKELEKSPEAASCAADLKKAKVGLINLQAYMNQVDCIEFAAAINNQYLFNVGSREGFGPWIAEAEKRIICRDEKPKAYEEVNSFEQNACAFLKEVVKANKMLQRVQQAAEGIKGNVVVQEEMSKLSERYYVLCKKADQRVKNLQHLMIEWQRLDEILAPTDPKDMDDLQTKQFLVFLRTYAAYFS